MPISKRLSNYLPHTFVKLADIFFKGREWRKL